jgi:hypothetical protein
MSACNEKFGGVMTSIIFSQPSRWGGKTSSSRITASSANSAQRALMGPRASFVSPNMGFADIGQSSIFDLEALLDRLPRQMAEAVRHVSELAKEDGEKPPALESVAGLARFLSTVKLKFWPAISLTPRGEIYARWKLNTDTIFSVQFLDSDRVAFARFLPKWNGGSESKSGHSVIDSLMDEADMRGQGWLVAGSTTITKAEPRHDILSTNVEPQFALN